MLLEDVPGVAKTMLARALARSVGCAFKRIQCTPDLLPTDMTGVSIFNQKTAEFEFRAGPVFAQMCSPTKSTAPRRAPKRPCSKPWPSAESPRTARLTPQAAVLGHRHAKSDRPRRHVPAAGSPARPLPHPAQSGLSARWRKRARCCMRLQHGHPIDDLQSGRDGRGSAGLPGGGARGSRR